MDVAITDLRAHLSDWLARVRRGEEVVVTDRGVPVARLTAVESAALLDQLTEAGQIARPAQPLRPVAAKRRRPRARRSIAEIVSEDRR